MKEAKWLMWLITGMLFTIYGVVDAEESEATASPLPVKADQWGEPIAGIAVQLIPQSKEYIIGKSMLFAVVVKNVSETIQEVDTTPSIFPFMITGPDPNTIHYKRGPFQTMSCSQKLKPDETLILLRDYDLTEEYAIITPGVYTLQYSTALENIDKLNQDSTSPGISDKSKPQEKNVTTHYSKTPELIIREGVPPSNILTINIKSGAATKEDLALVAIKKIVPPNSRWWLSGSTHAGSPTDREAVDEMIDIRISRDGFTDHYQCINIWLTPQTVASVNTRKLLPASSYLGRGDLGHVYTQIPSAVLNDWLTIEQDIINALNVSLPQNLTEK